MEVVSAGWTNTTHDWRVLVDEPHLAGIVEHPEVFAPGGARHLLDEVLAHVADEADRLNGGEPRCEVTLLPDGSLRVRDYGRGTDTRRDATGRIVRKPVMATKDLRFFDAPSTEALPDGHPRRGMSVVAALSDWLVHENRRLDGAWSQRYERGLPAEDLSPLEPDGTTGTLVHFRPTQGLLPVRESDLAGLQSDWPMLQLVVGAVTVRPAQSADAPSLHALRVELEQWLAARGVTQWDPGEVELQDVERQVAEGQWHLASQGGSPLGALRLLWSDEPVWREDDRFSAYVHGLMASRRAAGTGVGRALLAWAEDQARARNAPALRLDCVEGNARLRSYYRDLGFLEVGRRDFDGPWYSAVLLEKRLRGKP